MIGVTKMVILRTGSMKAKGSAPQNSNEPIKINDFRKSEEIFPEQTRFHHKRSDSRKRAFIGLLVVFFIGMMYGALLLKEDTGSFLESISTIEKNYLEDRFSQSVIKTLIASFISSFLFLLCSFLSGFSALGQVGAIFSLFLKGLGLGSCMGYLYLGYGLSGIGFSALFLLPAGAISVFALVLSAREAMRLSNLLFLSLVKGRECVLPSVLKLYFCKHGILLAMIVVSAFLDAVITFLFAGLFRLGVN